MVAETNGLFAYHQSVMFPVNFGAMFRQVRLPRNDTAFDNQDGLDHS